MKLRSKFILFVIIIHVIFLILSIQLLYDEELRIYFLLSELFIIISIYSSVRLYKSFMSPLELISHGIESIKSKDFNSKFVQVGQYELDQLIEMYNQMIEILREERIKQEEQHFFLERLIDASPVGIIILDLDEKLKHINPVAEGIFNINRLDLLKKSFHQIKHALIPFIDTIEEGESKIISLSNSRKYRIQKAAFTDRGFKNHFLMVQELTEEILKAEKESYGKIIRIMSHEVNNSIGSVNSILNSFKSYKKELKADNREDFINAINVSINRNDQLNAFLKKFAEFIKLPEANKESFDLIKLLKDTIMLMNPEAQNINVTWDCHADVFKVNIDVQQMEQVIINIIKNAKEAIGQNGEIHIETKMDSLVISDNGSGIKDKSKLFSPFYSTKVDGSGIGLMLIRDILLNHKFDFSLDSDGGWTRFRIEF